MDECNSNRRIEINGEVTEVMENSRESVTVQTILKNAIVISGGVQQTLDNCSTNTSGTCTPDSKKSFTSPKKSQTRIRRSKSTGALDKKLISVYDLDSSSDSFDSSLESLIKKNLLNAKAMQPVPVSKAKERNFLHGRFGLDSLLGRTEMERIFPKSEVTIFISTWNMNGEEPPSNLNELFLPDKMENLADIYVIGTQESYSETTEWEASIQETLGPTHVLFHSETLGTIFIGVFLRRELIWYCSLPEDDSYSVRPGAAFKTKGAVGICFYVFGTSFLFICSHLTAHDYKLQERISDVNRIMKSLKLPKDLPVNRMMLSRSKSVVYNFDYVFWFGDLNFRLTQPRDQVLDWIECQKFPMDANSPFPFYDQLMSCMKKGLVFRNFQEAPILFPPSYKFDPGTQHYDTSHKKRTPSYTDRILFKSRKIRGSILSQSNNYIHVKCSAYTSVPSICTSDHKPVWGLYSCKIRPGLDTIPLAAGRFNREIYLEGLKRRRAHFRKGFNLSDSKSCSIQ